ncbi:outer membrane lipoprotein carrier protein LolA [Salinicoccus hispanicus]|uniref:LolA family protein n=1 Tax=Salinicoccus hispanicus TaxID=157225 RepID=UPI0036166632
MTREWFCWEEGELHTRKEIERAGAPTQYITGNDQDAIIYMEGEDMAIRSESLVQGTSLPASSEVVKQKIERYKRSHNSARAGMEDVNDRRGHRLTFTPKRETANSGTKVDLWIDSEHWLVLKEVMNQKGLRMVYEVVTFIDGIEPSMDLFHLELPEGVEIVDQ